MDRQSLPSYTTLARRGFKRRAFHVSNSMKNYVLSIFLPRTHSFFIRRRHGSKYLARNIWAILDMTHGGVSICEDWLHLFLQHEISLNYSFTHLQGDHRISRNSDTSQFSKCIQVITSPKSMQTNSPPTFGRNRLGA